MARQRVRLAQVRRADSFNDQKTPAAVAGTETANTSQEAVFETVITQILHILGAGATDWKDQPAAGLSDLVPATLDCDCLGTDAVGDFVYVTGDAVAGRPQVTKADITDVLKLPALGVITLKPTGTTCTVQWKELAAVGGLTSGRVHWVGLDGKATAVVPAASGHYAQKVGMAVSSNLLLLAPDYNLVRRA